MKGRHLFEYSPTDIIRVVLAFMVYVEAGADVAAADIQTGIVMPSLTEMMITIIVSLVTFVMKSS